MIYIDKREEPEWFTEFKKKYPKATYDSKEFRPYISRLNEELVKEQKYICAYCCCEIDTKKSHNEHIEPRHSGTYVSKRSLDYSNLVASCYGFQGERTCGPKKENNYDEKKFISPLNPACEDIFNYFPNGVIDGDVYTTELLNLNSHRLRQAREAIYNTIQELDEESIRIIYPDDGEKLPPFVNVVKWYIKQNFEN